MAVRLVRRRGVTLCSYQLDHIQFADIHRNRRICINLIYQSNICLDYKKHYDFNDLPIVLSCTLYMLHTYITSVSSLGETNATEYIPS